MKKAYSITLEETALGPVLLAPHQRKGPSLTVACVLTAARSEYLRGVNNGPWLKLLHELVDRIGFGLFGRKFHWGPQNLQSWDYYCSCVVTPANAGAYLLSFTNTGELPTAGPHESAEVIMLCGPTGLYPNSFIALTQDRQDALDRILEDFRIKELAKPSSTPADFPWAAFASHGDPVEGLSSQMIACATSASRVA